MNKLLELLKVEAKQITLGFEKASIEGKGTSQEVADRREEVFVNGFLSKYFPFPYRVVKGNIIDSYGKSSQSIDCIVLSPSHPYTIDVNHGEASVILADGVDFAIEVKPDIVSFNEVKRGLKQIQSVKRLRRRRTSFISGLDKLNKAMKTDTIYQIPTFIFSTKGPTNIKEFIRKIYDFYEAESVTISEQFDYIVVNNQYLIANSHEGGYTYIGDTNGICFTKSGEDTLAYFLYELNRLPRSEMQMSKNILSFYIDPREINDGFETFLELNSHYR